MSLLDVLCPGYDFRTGCNQAKQPGSIVMTGRNRGPLYTIVAIDGPSAWVRHLDSGRDGIAPLDNLRVV